MDRILKETKFFQLVERRKKGLGNGGNKRRWYEIKVRYWSSMTLTDLQKTRDICDPLRCKSGRYFHRWRFRSKPTAEKYYMMLILAFGL